MSRKRRTVSEGRLRVEFIGWRDRTQGIDRRRISISEDWRSLLSRIFSSFQNLVVNGSERFDVASIMKDGVGGVDGRERPGKPMLFSGGRAVPYEREAAMKLRKVKEPIDQSRDFETEKLEAEAAATRRSYYSKRSAVALACLALVLVRCSSVRQRTHRPTMTQP